MSTLPNKSNHYDNEEKLSNLKAILGNEIPRARLTQILEASNGSLEHAIEIYFHQKEQKTEHVQAHGMDDLGDAKRKCAPLIISVEDEASSESIEPKRQKQISKNKTKPDIYENHNRADTVVDKKRSQKQISSPQNSTKRASAKQARLHSFFKADSGKVLVPPVCNGADREGSITNDKRKKNGKIYSSDLDCYKGTNYPTTNIPTAHAHVLNARSSSFNSLPTSSNVTIAESSDGDLKKECVGAYFKSCFSFERLCETLQEMTDTTKRLVKLKALETFIREIVDSKSIVDIGSNRGERNDLCMRVNALSSALALVLGGGTSTPLNVSGSAVSKALQTSLGITRNQISKTYQQSGDLGNCAASFFQKKTNFFIAANARRRLSILHVTEGLRKITETDGRGAKQHVVHTLLLDCQTKIECRFLVRLLIRNMRIGANIKTVLAALAMSMIPASTSDGVEDETQTSNESSSSTNLCYSKIPKIDTRDAITLVQKTYDVCPNIAKIVGSLLEGGFDQMQRDCSIQVMTPIAPMLAHPVHSLDEVKEKMGYDGETATMEWKYDGMRCQAHFDGVNIKLFSRHMLDMTDQFPDVMKCLLDAMRTKSTNGCNSFVMDAEIVGVERKGGESRLLPFQDLSTRRKKMDDGNGITVKVFAFDLMFLNGESLVNEQLFKRRSMLHDLFEETIAFSFVSSKELISYDESTIKSYLSEAIEGGAEGLMMKLLGKKSILVTNEESSTIETQSEGVTSFYEAGTRSHCWLKVKRDYVAGFSDTIDVVPIGAWRGSGRKAQKSFLSPVLLAVYDDEEDVYRSICRCMSFTDAMYESMREFYFNGVEYAPCIDSGVLQNTSGNPEEKDCAGQHTNDKKQNIGGDCEIEVCDVQDENTDDSKPTEDDEEAKVQNRVHCFSNRPSSAFVITNESPPIWFKPMEVFEVAFADLSLSRQHTAAAGLVDEEGRGVALRFPRFKRRRPDKKPEQATTSIEIAQLFAKQTKIKNGSQVFKPNRSI